MQCTATKEHILEAVTRAEKATGKNTTLPVLSCVLLTVKDDALTVTATNLEVGVTYSVPVQKAQEGSVAVSASVLSQVIATLPKGAQVTFEATEGHLAVTSAGGSSKLSLQDKDEFPALPNVEDAEEVTLPAKALVDALTSVSYCASNSTIKPELSSVFVHPNSGTLIAAATDSFRLAEKRVALKDPINTTPFLIPVRSVTDLLKALELADDSVTLKVGEHQLSLTLPGVYMTLRLTAGTFPDYTAIIPKEYVSEATILRFDLEHVLRRAAVFVDQFNQTTISIAPKKKVFSVHTSHASVGETTDNVSAALTGDELTISFNQRYLMDALTPITNDSVSLQFAGQSLPAVVRPVGDTSFLYLVMPMNK